MCEVRVNAQRSGCFRTVLSGGPNGIRSNLHNSSTRFHCTLIIRSLAPSGFLTAQHRFLVWMWLRGPAITDVELACLRGRLRRRLMQGTTTKTNRVKPMTAELCLTVSLGRSGSFRSIHFSSRTAKHLSQALCPLKVTRHRSSRP